MVISNPQATIPLQTDADGAVRVSGTRVTLDTVIEFYQQGYTAEQIAEGFNTLLLADIHSVIGYYLSHRADVDAYLAQRRRQHDQIKRECEAKSPSNGLRERLLARKSERGL